MERHFEVTQYAEVKRMNFRLGKAEEDTLIPFPLISQAENTQSI